MKVYKDSNGLTRSAALYVPADRVRNPSSGRSLCAKVGIVACDLSGLAHSPLQGHFIDDWGWAGNAIEVAETRERILNGRARFADLAALLGIDGVTMEERRDSGRSLFEEAACRASLELRPAPASVPTVCSTVRYVHLATGEFINVGAVAWGKGTLAWRFASNLGRARAFQDDEIVEITMLIARFKAGVVTTNELQAMCGWGEKDSVVQFDGPYTSPLAPWGAVDRLIAERLRPEDLMPA